MAFRIRKETDHERIKAMLDLSGTTVAFMFFSFLAMGVSGLILPFLFHFWNKGWVWLSIVLTLFVFIWMGFMNERNYKVLRRLVDDFQAILPALRHTHLRFSRLSSLTE